jgi:hypothetical protein
MRCYIRSNVSPQLLTDQAGVYGTQVQVWEPVLAMDVNIEYVNLPYLFYQPQLAMVQPCYI